ncbi:sensor histidine kinase [Patescibacteria group bacterium]|nr:MAG: sensor histidine kinase [Patescibacteria group bacterium]
MELSFLQSMQQICLDSVAAVNASFIYYTHIPVAVISLLVGIFVLIKNRDLTSKILFALSLLFSLFITFNLITWLSSNTERLMFFWSFFGILISGIFLLCFYLSYVFLFNRDLSTKTKFSLLVLMLPIILITPSRFDVGFLDSIYCTPVENTYFIFYYYLFGIVSSLATLSLLIRRNKQVKDKKEKRKNVIFVLGIEIFILMFFFSSFLVSYLNDLGVLTSYSLEQYGFIGMVVFMAFLAYLIVKFKAFDIKMVGAQALVWALVILIGSEFLFVTTTINQILVGITLVISAILGLILVRSVKKEVAQRERIEELAGDLVKSNEKLESANIKLKELDKLKSEFLSLASHQIRNPLTAIKGYASLILDGTYGDVSTAVREAVDRMYQSTQSLVTIVSDFLDISRIEQGTMKYDFTSFDIKKLAIQVVEEFRPNIMKAGLTISSVAGPGDYFVNADQGKIKQVIGNLIDNSIKYTPQGSIKVALSRHSLSDGTSGRVRVTVSDTGVGIDEAVIPQLFAKFTRDKDAFKTNVSGTGLGLYLAKQMVQAHHGKIWAESDGKGKGSRFIIELDTIR